MFRYARTTVIIIAVGGFVAIVYGFAVRAERVIQPIEFNHVVHLDDAGISCEECHTNAARSVYAGLPGKDMCLDCHDIDEEADSHPEKDKLFVFDESDEDIPWRRVAVTRPDVYFSHRRHVTSAKLDCLECHVDQRTLSIPPRTIRLVMSMDACIECHEQSDASTDCLACHR